jgi:hypothetical protein
MRAQGHTLGRPISELLAAFAALCVLTTASLAQESGSTDRAALLRTEAETAAPAPPDAPPSLPAPDATSLLLPAPPPPIVDVPSDRSGDYSFFVSTDFLLMQPQRRATDFAITSTTNDGTPQGQINTLPLQTSTGVRVGAGAGLPGSTWQFGAYYTYLHSSDAQSVTAPPGGAVYATVTHPGFVSLVTNAAGSTNLNYQVLDLEGIQRFMLSDTTTLRLIVGGRFAWIDQSFSTYYNGLSANQAFLTSPVNFYGAGLRVGAEGQWAVFRGFGVYARAAGSLLAGDYHTQLSETNNAGATILTNVTDDFRKLVPVAEMALGITWQRNNWRARLGYEMSNWFGLVDSPDFVDDVSNKLGHRLSDLGLSGMALQVQWSH